MPKPSLRKVQKILTKQGVDFSTWGTHGTKSIHELLEEIHESEAVLVPDAVHGCVRHVNVARVNVLYKDELCSRHLVEVCQVFTDGTVRKRKLSATISEKCQESESFIEAAIRGLHEELAVIGGVNLRYKNSSQEVVDSPSYPGLTSVYKLQLFTFWMPPEQYVPMGYIEVQATKSTYFAWQENV